MKESDKLDKLRKEMDKAANESRRRPEDAMLENRRGATEGAHRAQMDVLTKVFERLESDVNFFFIKFDHGFIRR